METIVNIFVTDMCPVISAQSVCDKHSSKMVVESGQMLSTAHRMLDGQMELRRSKSGKRMVKYFVHPNSNLEAVLYKAVHHYHPCTVWSMESKENYIWHYKHFVALAEEFEFRYGKNHMTINKLREVLKAPPSNIPSLGLTEFPQAMSHFPDCKVEGNPVQAYRNYYHMAKPFAKWEKGRSAPNWWEGYKGLNG
jgi:hypothetical protein